MGERVKGYGLRWLEEAKENRYHRQWTRVKGRVWPLGFMD